MTTTIVVANSNDGFITSGDPANWDIAINGNALAATNGQVRNRYGAEYAFGIWWAYQTFLQFGYTRPANEVEVAVTIGVLHAGHYGAQSRQMLMHSLGVGTGLGAWFGATVDAPADWVNPLGVLLTQRMTTVFDVQASGTNQYVWVGSNALTQRLRTYGNMAYQFVLSTERQFIYGLYPPGQEFSEVWSGETSLAPVMVVSTVPQSTLHGVAGAQVQLSDGSWAVIESNGAVPPTLTLGRVDTGGTPSLFHTLSGFATDGSGMTAGGGSQQVTLTADSADNLYVVGGWAAVTNAIGVQAFIKGTGATWTPQAPLAAPLPFSLADANNFAAAWHSVGGGTLVAMLARGSSDGWHVSSSEQCVAVLSGSAALAGSGTLLRSSAVAVGPLTPQLSAASWITPANDTGSNLDVTALSPTTGVMHTLSRYDRLGSRQPSCKARYTLTADGTALSSYFHELTTGLAGATWAVKTAAGKVRVIPISTDTVAVLTADSVWGISVAILRNSGGSPTFTTLGWILLGNESIPAMPAAATLSESQAWDAAYFPGPNKLWVYYPDVADSRTIRRTSINLATNLAARDSVLVASSLGSAGSTNLAIRATRGSASNRRNLVTATNRSSGGSLTTIYVPDAPLSAPNAPTLTTRSNFDATQAAVFQWTFSDPDGTGVVADTQTQYQLDINTSVGVDTYDSGIVVSAAQSVTLPGGTLTNPGAWQWRVRTWDESSTPGPYSAYATFSTAAGGTVTITSPALDNPPDVITSTWPVSWTLLGATQAAYRVVVIRTSNSAEAYNSGWVTSSATSHTIAGMLTDVEYRIEVTTRTVGLVESNTATRLITPSFGTPDTPEISVLEQNDAGHTLLAVSNPTPTGDRPDVVHNEIRRRVEATTTKPAGLWVSIGATAIGGTWRDFTAASNTVYEYQCVAVAADGSYQLSTRVDGRLCLSGVWIHDPTDPAAAQANVQHYPYGWRGKQDETAVVGEGTHYAGRELPVFDFGEHADETMTVPIQVPKGDTWYAQFTALQDLARVRRTLCVRDAIGRRVFGVITVVPRVDETYGTSSTLTVTSVDYLERYTAYGDPVVVAGDGEDSDTDDTTDGWDGGDVTGGHEETIDGGDICGGDPCDDDEIADGSGV